MNVEIKDVDKIQKELNVTLSTSDMEKYLESASERLAQDMKVKGFREGKIPRNVVESSVGSEKVWQEALNEAVQESYWQAIEENDVDPIGMPKIDIVKFIPGQDIEYKALIPCMPDIELPDYKNIAQKTMDKEKKGVEVDEKEVESSLKWLQNSRASASGDAEEEAPELNDEFAKNIGGFENLDALKDSIRDGIHKEKEAQEKERIRILILEKIRKQIELKIPDFMIDQELDKMEEEFAQEVQRMGMSIEQYLERAQKNMEEVRKGWREKAEERVASGILLRAIAEKENIEADKDEVEKEANKYLMQFQSVEEAQEHIDPERLRSYISGIIRNEKVFDMLEGKNNASGDSGDSPESADEK